MRGVFSLLGNPDLMCGNSDEGLVIYYTNNPEYDGYVDLRYNQR